MFSTIDKGMMFLQGTPIDSGSVGLFFLTSFCGLAFFPPNGISVCKSELQQNDCVLPQNDHTISKVEVQFA